jgi:hypothetical protein
LEVMPNGSKYWRMKYRFGGKEKRLAFGVYPLVSLALAREKARFAKLELIDGKDPGEIKKQEKLIRRIASSNTFSAKLLVPLRQIENDGQHETANRAKRAAGQVMRYAVGLGLADRDPSQDLKDALVTARANHRAAVTDPKELRKILLVLIAIVAPRK